MESTAQSDDSLEDYAHHLKNVPWATVHYILGACRLNVSAVCRVPIKWLNNEASESKIKYVKMFANNFFFSMEVKA